MEQNFDLGPRFGTRPPKGPKCVRVSVCPTILTHLKTEFAKCNIGILLVVLKATSGQFPLMLYVGLPRSPSRLIKQFEKSTPLTVFELGFSNFQNILILPCPKNRWNRILI